MYKAKLKWLEHFILNKEIKADPNTTILHCITFYLYYYSKKIFMVQESKVLFFITITLYEYTKDCEHVQHPQS